MWPSSNERLHLLFALLSADFLLHGNSTVFLNFADMKFYTAVGRLSTQRQNAVMSNLPETFLNFLVYF